MPSVDFTTFNILEGIFWCVLSLLSLYTHKFIPDLGKTFWYLLSADFLFFGLSDFAEVSIQASFFTVGFEWLFIWKVICIGIFFLLFCYYLWKRVI